MNLILKSYALLSSLKQNLPNTFAVSKVWVDDFHAILTALERETGDSLEEFRVSDGEWRQRAVTHNRLTGHTQYDKNLTVQRERLLLKVDAVLGYFQFQTTPDKQPIGFQKE
jgi:hypothetical protein